MEQTGAGLSGDLVLCTGGAGGNEALGVLLHCPNENLQQSRAEVREMPEWQAKQEE